MDHEYPSRPLWTAVKELKRSISASDTQLTSNCPSQTTARLLNFVGRDERQRARGIEGGGEHLGARETVHVASNGKAEEIQQRRGDVDHRTPQQPPRSHGRAERHHESIGR